MTFFGALGRFILVIVNVVLFLFGITLVVCGALSMKFNIKDLEGLSKFGPGTIILGCIVIIFGFLGCCGAYQDRIPFLLIYILLLLALVICSLALAVICLTQSKKKIEDRVTPELTSWFGNYSTNPESEKLVNRIQKEFKCCGLEGPEYWKNDYPTSCCPDKKKCTAEDINTEGCLKTVIDFINDFSRATGGVAAVFALICVVGILITWMVISDAREEED